MSTSICIKGYSGKNSPEFIKHQKAVIFCIENDLSFPIETSEFFKGRIQGDSLEDYTSDSVIEYIREGIEVELDSKDPDGYGNEYHINVADIPAEVETIIVKYC